MAKPASPASGLCRGGVLHSVTLAPRCRARASLLALCAALAVALALTFAPECGAGGGASGNGQLRGQQRLAARPASASAFVSAFDASLLALSTSPSSPSSAAALSDECARLLPALQREFVQVLRGALKPAYLLHEVDSAALVPFLRRFYAGVPRPLLIDVGANVGGTSEALMRFLCPGDLDALPSSGGGGGHRASHNSKETPSVCAGAPEEALRGGRVLAYEPMAANFRDLELRGAQRFWGSAGWRAFQVALVAPEQALSGAVPAQVKFYSSFKAGDEEGGLAANSSKVGEGDFALVTAWTLDAHLDSVGEGSAPVLLLKVDAEGFDAHVLRGAARLLRERRVTFLTFEYNWKWKSDPGKATLHNVVEQLSGFGYNCWLMETSHLLPLSGRWWSAEYEFFNWRGPRAARRPPPAALPSYLLAPRVHIDPSPLAAGPTSCALAAARATAHCLRRGGTSASPCSSAASRAGLAILKAGTTSPTM
jgi:FkbM family methyltransferase